MKTPTVSLPPHVIHLSRPSVRELSSADLVKRVRKEKSVCFLLVTSDEDQEASDKLKVWYVCSVFPVVRISKPPERGTL